MDPSKQGSKSVHYGVPLFVCLYFILAFYPKYIGNEKEIIPFSLFNLYTFIPYDYSNYDLQITDSSGNSKLLFFENSELTPIERKYYYSWLREIGEEFVKTNAVKFDSTHFAIKEIKGQVDFIRLSGDYAETIKNGTYNLEILKRIK